LLLHLIQKHELDILDIPIGFITEKYVEYITRMQELSIDIASEYLVMAAHLAHIKSKMLLPPSAEPEAEEGEEADLDPRAELVRRLLEYQKYKLAAEQLSTRSVLGRDLFARGMPAPADEGPAPLAPISLFKLLDALESVLERVRRTQDHLIDFERISISDRINQLSDILKERKSIIFDELFAADRSRADVIVTFLALLEMTRLRLTRIHQDGPLEAIRIELAVVEDGEGEAPEQPPLDSGGQAGETLDE
jgi:segregation and condensation protein A